MIGVQKVPGCPVTLSTLYKMYWSQISSILFHLYMPRNIFLGALLIQRPGHLFRFTNGLSRDTIKSSLTIPNSIGWSPDNKTLYFTHTTESKILAYDYDLKTGEATNERVFYHHKVAGHPDGFKVDVEGNLWQTLYAGSKVLKISPEGKVIGEIVFPEARNLTCPAFAGTDLWVTSAKDGESKYGGGLFKVNVGVRGLESVAFKIEQSIDGL